MVRSMARQQTIDDSLARAREAVARRSWREAYDLLTSADASGDLSPEDYQQRFDALGPRPRRVLTPLAVAVTTVGLIGALTVGATAGPGFMHTMMGGGWAR